MIPKETLPPFAAQWLAQRQLGFERLESMRRDELRHMSERDAATIFAKLDPPHPYVLRSGSGLVDQQRRFRKVWERINAAQPSRP